jgi:DNA-binding MarR family transcriptional regulator
MQAAPKPDVFSQQAFEAADRVHSAAIHLLRGLRIRDRESGLGPAQLSALSVLVFAGPKSLAELAQAEQVKPPTMSRIVAALVRTKLVRMVTNDKDRRAVVIIPTSKGIALMQKARLRRVESLARAVDALDAAEVALLRNAAEMIEKLSRVVGAR